MIKKNMLVSPVWQEPEITYPEITEQHVGQVTSTRVIEHCSREENGGAVCGLALRK